MVEAGISGFFKTLRGDVSRYWIMKVELLYQEAASAGDVLSVYVWEDDVTAMLVHAVMDKSNRRIGQCSIKFEIPTNSHL